MPRSVHISTEIPPPASMEESLNISPADTQELIEILRQTRERLERDGQLSYTPLPFRSAPRHEQKALDRAVSGEGSR